MRRGQPAHDANTALEGAHSGARVPNFCQTDKSRRHWTQEIVHWLDEAKAEDIKTIDLAGKTLDR